MNKTHQIILGQLFAGILTLLALILAARLCGPGVLSESFSLILVLSVILDLVDFGTCSWSARELAASRIRSKRYFENMISRAEMSFLTTPVTILFCLSNGGISNNLAALSIYPPLWIVTNYVQQFLFVNEKITVAIALQIVERSCWLLTFPAILIGLNQHLSFILPILVGLFLHIIIGIQYIKKRFTLKMKRKNWNLHSFKQTRHFGGIGVITDIGNLDTPIITAITTINEAGSFTLSQRFRNPSQLPFQAISIRIRNYAALGNASEVKTFLKKETRLVLFSVLSLTLLSGASFGWANQLFGDSYLYINEILSLSFLTAIPSGLSVIISGILTGFGHEKFVLKSLFTSVGLNILMCIVLGSLFNALVVAVFLLASNWILLLIFLLKAKLSLE